MIMIMIMCFAKACPCLRFFTCSRYSELLTSFLNSTSCYTELSPFGVFSCHLRCDILVFVNYVWWFVYCNCVCLYYAGGFGHLNNFWWFYWLLTWQAGQFIFIYTSLPNRDNSRRGVRPRGGTPLYGLYRYVRPQRVWFSAVLVINRVSSFARFRFSEEATSSSCPPSPIRAFPSSIPFNAWYI